MLRTFVVPVIALSLASTSLAAQDTTAVDTEYKHPTTARIYGIVPGGGHMYAGEVVRGIQYYITTTTVLAGAAILGVGCLDNSVDECTGEGELLLVSGLVMWGWSIYDAGRAAERANARRRLGMSVMVRPVLREMRLGKTLSVGFAIAVGREGEPSDDGASPRQRIRP